MKVKKQKKLSVIIITLNEEGVIKECLESVRQLAEADELVVLDGGSTDKTLEIAKRYQAKIFPQEVKEKDWAAWHNQGKKEATGEWIFYLDADERITPCLKKEIQQAIKDKQFNAYAVPRQNILLGKAMKFGGWYPDYQIRLFRKDKLLKWQGRVHERPIFQCVLGYLQQPMLHLTHRNLALMVDNANWRSAIEARLLYQSNHPPVVWWRILRVMASEFFDRFVKKQAWRDGVIGWIEGLFQVFNKFLIYGQLWEIQNKRKS